MMNIIFDKPSNMAVFKNIEDDDSYFGVTEESMQTMLEIIQHFDNKLSLTPTFYKIKVHPFIKSDIDNILRPSESIVKCPINKLKHIFISKNNT